EELELEDEEIQEIKELSNDDEIFQKIADSIAPSIYGHEKVKEAVALQLFGGVKKTREDGVKSRGDIHILLIGEPGTGKSQILKFTGELSPKGRYVVGKSSTGAGLCVTGDTTVHTGEGLRRIEDIVEERIDFEVERETARETSEKLETYSSGNLDTEEASLMWKMPEKSCVKLETSFGKEIEASENTDILACGEEGIEWKKIDEIEKDDFVAAPEYQEVERNDPDVKEYLEFRNEKLKLATESVDKIRKQMKDEYGSLREAASELELTETFVYDTLPNRRVPFKQLDYILDELGIKLDELEIEDIMIRHGDQVEIPDRFDRELMYLTGLLFGDGNISVTDERGLVRITNGDREILERAQDIIQDKFGKEVEIETQDNRVPYLRLYSRTAAKFFSGLGMQTPKNDLSLDYRLTNAENADSFLKGLMDADGSVVQRDDGSDSIQLSTVSEELGKQVQLMLETYGIKARKRVRDRGDTQELEDGRRITPRSEQTHLIIRGKHIDRFQRKIGFDSRKKSEALEKITGVDRNTNNDSIPVTKLLSNSSAKPGDHWSYFNQDKNPGRQRTVQ
ncbi:MAG: LAGLIDADG family homing endonuclease, partial [Candidatus Nanohaloarchaea archaeon]